MSNALAAVPDLPDTKALAGEAAIIVAQANGITVTDHASYKTAVEFGQGVRSLQKRIADFFAPHKRNAKAAHDALCADEKQQLAPVDLAIQVVKTKLIEFDRAERVRLEAEQKRREAEAQKLEEERRLQEVVDLVEEDEAAAGEAYEELKASPPPAPFVAVSRPAQKVTGAATTKRWTLDPARVDLDSVIKHIAGIPQGQPLAHPELRNLLAVDAKTARQLITAMKDQFRVPGIHAYEADGISLSAK